MGKSALYADKEVLRVSITAEKVEYFMKKKLDSFNGKTDIEQKSIINYFIEKILINSQTKELTIFTKNNPIPGALVPGLEMLPIS